ncbi:ABC transporter substrate-binding protein [Streptomyces pinistramenti]|uniref:ABC transporter substrate-binding protein n=1 Tax=Streptomyces pinistramenti TaxID=2884812 RepID=UPI001D088D6C|nr:extracellular solute-binding protein [Streptomyces pinistramenti]MCB5910333.1 extracellular solute-binding protein [Streptomyces pinistramenti]
MHGGSRTSRTVVILTAVTALGAALLAGCADDSGDDAGGKTVISVGTFGVFGYQQAGLYKEYEKLHPDVTIKESVIERNDIYYPQLLTHLAAGSGLSDIQAIEVGNINEVATTQADKFEDLSGAPGVDKKRWLDWKWAQATAPDGRTVGLGTDIGPTALCYRKDLFRKAGLPTRRDEVGKLWAGDWQKYVDTGVAYRKKAPKGTVFMDSASGLFNAVVNGYADRFYDAEGKLIYQHSPAVKTAWRLATGAAEGGLTARLKQFEKPWDQAFANGRFATVACAPWMLGYIKEKAGAAGKDKWDVAPAPRPGNWGGSFIAVPRAARHKAQAIDLAVWLTRPEQQAKVFAGQASIPSTPAAYRLPAVKDARNPYFGDAPTGTIFSAAAQGIPTLRIGPKDQQIAQAFTDVGVLQVEQQGKSPEAGWRAAVEDIQSAVDG